MHFRRDERQNGKSVRSDAISRLLICVIYNNCDTMRPLDGSYLLVVLLFAVCSKIVIVMCVCNVLVRGIC